MNAVAELVRTLVGKSKQRQVELKKSNWERYREIRNALHAGRTDTDVDEFGVILEALDKTPEALAKDVEVYGKRVREAERLATKPQLEALIKTNTAKVEKLVAERDEHYRKMQDQIKPLSEAVRSAETELLICSSSHDYLQQSCDDPSILQREAELGELSRDLHQRGAALKEARHQIDIKVTRAHNELEAIERRMKSDEVTQVSRDHYRKEVTQIQSELVPLLERQRNFDADQQAIDDERAPLVREQQELSKRKLIP